jgi:hypothetical protein
MKRKKKMDVFEIIQQFQTAILSKKPSQKEMLQQVRMMKYKIRPVNGDISFLNFKNTQFIEALWSLGKLDDFFQEHFEKLPVKQQEVFFRLVDNMKYEFQNELNNAHIKPELPAEQLMFEMEIYKERSKNVN